MDGAHGVRRKLIFWSCNGKSNGDGAAVGAPTLNQHVNSMWEIEDYVLDDWVKKIIPVTLTDVFDSNLLQQCYALLLLFERQLSISR